MGLCSCWMNCCWKWPAFRVCHSCRNSTRKGLLVSRKVRSSQQKQRRHITTTVSSVFTAAPTKFRRTSSPNRFWVFERGKGMDFSLNDMQQMMQDSASRFIANEYDFETRRKLADSELGFSEHNWQTFAELGWLALMVPEEYGGLGGTIQDAIVLQEKLGKGMVVEPFFSTVILSANLINKAGSSEQKDALLSKIAGGTLKVALAHGELEASGSVRIEGMEKKENEHKEEE